MYDPFAPRRDVAAFKYSGELSISILPTGETTMLNGLVSALLVFAGGTCAVAGYVLGKKVSALKVSAPFV